MGNVPRVGGSGNQRIPRTPSTPLFPVFPVVLQCAGRSNHGEHGWSRGKSAECVSNARCFRLETSPGGLRAPGELRFCCAVEICRAAEKRRPEEETFSRAFRQGQKPRPAVKNFRSTKTRPIARSRSRKTSGEPSSRQNSHEFCYKKSLTDVSDRTQSSRHIPCAVHRIPLRIRRSRTAHGVCLLLLSETF